MKYLRKIKEIGVRNCFKILNNRFNGYFFTYFVKNKAINKSAGFSWQEITKIHKLDNFDSFFIRVKNNIPDIFSYINQNNNNQDDIASLSQDFLENKFKIFGKSFIRPKNEWHFDFSSQKFNFYKDIKINITEANNLKEPKEVGPDIKFPWELSRLQYFPVLGRAYSITNQAQFPQKFMADFVDWKINNPYMLGVNWLCPMEVGIRAINLIHAFWFFKDSNQIYGDFWQDFFCSLYDHFVYLENNWEIYDTKTSNHYLSDLCGYIYLCYIFQYFKISKKINWVIKEISQEFEKQVFDEGTDYEGSTCYHRLVTELFWHSFMISQKLGYKLTFDQQQKLNNMFKFINLLQVSKGYYVSIGDNDSGKVLYWGLPDVLINGTQPQEVIFKNFGLTIYQNSKAHLTFRTHSYNKKQPSGHFHNDFLSVTLSVNQEPIIIDPGSFVYTSSAQWRNFFRSASMHNNFCLYDNKIIEPAKLDSNKLFYLPLEQANNSHNVFYAKYNLKAARSLTITNNTINIIDQWISLNNQALPNLKSFWNFTFAPEIVLQKEKDYIIIKKSDIILAYFYSDLDFNITDGYGSYEYGTKFECQRLTSLSNLSEALTITKICLNI